MSLDYKEFDAKMKRMDTQFLLSMWGIAGFAILMLILKACTIE